MITNPNLIRTKDIQKLCDALTKGFNLLSLTFERCKLSENALNVLLDIVINRSSIRHLVMSKTTINFREWLRTFEYTCGCISVQINNQSCTFKTPDDITEFYPYAMTDISLSSICFSQEKHREYKNCIVFERYRNFRWNCLKK